MTIKLVSDLHLEHEENKHYLAENLFPTNGDILILAGDITYIERLDNDFEKIFFKYLSDNYEKVFYLPGNSEFHGLTNLKNYDTQIYETLHSNVFLVNNQSIDLGNIKLILTTLWTHIRAENMLIISKSVKDFQMIDYGDEVFNPIINNELNTRALNFIETQLASSDKTNIIITHHAPSQHCANDEYDSSQLGDAFFNDLDDMIQNSNITYWLHGHTHFNKELIIGNTIIISNQMGLAKYKEYQGFNPDFLIEL